MKITVYKGKAFERRLKVLPDGAEWSFIHQGCLHLFLQLHSL